eukprot:Skav215378  [mRNA]  locus=scaffold3586:132527:136886:+ [translate_table: standard]
MDELLKRLSSGAADAIRAALGMNEVSPGFARVMNVEGETLCCHRAFHGGHRGLQVVEPCVNVTLCVPPGHQCKVGDWIGFRCPSSTQTHVTIQQTHQLWRISPGRIQGKWVAVHLFAGAFNGWSRAFDWLKNKGLFQTERSLAIDKDDLVVDTWKKQGCSMTQSCHIDDPAFHSPWCGFHGKISDHQWLNWLRGDEDLWMSMSPPCQSWSAGGRSSGLFSGNGLAFLEGIGKAKDSQPVVLTCECSDAIVKHPHFVVVKQAIWDAGYKLVWTGQIDSADIINMKRLRWLAVYIRVDIEARSLGNFKFTNMAKPSWDDCTFRFHVPEAVRSQLVLQPSSLEFYGHPDFLPQNMKRHVQPPGQQKDVLRARVLSPHAMMPTLCASYTRQHCLSIEHLENKGIYAVLKGEGDSITFFDPLMFIGMMGCLETSPVVLPLDVAAAFSQIGNCISVHHAIVTICIGLVAASVVDIPIKSTVMKCFEQRIQAERCHVFHNATNLWISAERNIPSDIVHAWNRDALSNGFLCVDGTMLPIDLDQPINAMFTALNWDPCKLAMFRCFVGDSQISMTSLLRSLIGQRIRIVFQTTEVIQGMVVINDLQAPNESTGEDATSVVMSHDDDDGFCLPDDCDFDRCPATMVTIYHFPQRSPTYLMCQTPAVIPEVHKAVSLSSNCSVQIYEMRSIGGFSSDFCVLAAREPIPQDHVCVVRIDAVKQESLVELISVGDNEQHQYEHGHVLWKQTPRELMALHHGAKLASDELKWFANHFNSTHEVAFIETPIVICQPEPCFDQVTNCLIALWKKRSKAQHILFPVWEDGHWAGVEVVFGAQMIASLVGFHNHATAMKLYAAVQVAASRIGLISHACHCTITVGKNMCGWSMLLHWIDSTGCCLMLPTFHDHDAEMLVQQTFHEVEGYQNEVQKASAIRVAFIKSAPSIAADVVFGGADEDEDMKQKGKDPWHAFTGDETFRDPWLPPTNTSHVRNAKWEDLKLAPDHHFLDDGGNQLAQIHRQQMSSGQGGISFVTRANVASVLQAPPSTTAAILVPVCESSFFNRFQPNPTIVGPMEITVADPVAQKVYKRQALLVHVAKTTTIKAVTAGYKSSLTALREIVFELDTRLASRETLASLQSNPQVPQEQNLGVVSFGLTAIIGNVWIQEGEVSSRDFVERGDAPSDHSILPKFWEVSRSGREDVLRTVSKVDGVAGIVITRRGLAVRSWNDKLQVTRAAIMSGDSRLCSANMATIPRVQMESSGWPSHITAIEIVKACQFYTKLAPVPSRAYRSAGVTYWTLLFPEEPQMLKFLVTFDTQTYEILLTKHDPASMHPIRKPKTVAVDDKSKGKGKGKGNIKPNPSAKESDSNSDRITSLESRFALMEKKQTVLETKVDDSFAEVNNQLRQILQAVCPRDQSQPATGCTPPPKVHKAQG